MTRRRRARLRLLAGLLPALLWAAPVRADIFLIVQAANPLKALTQKEAVDLYTGRSRAFGNGEFALMFDLPRDSPQRAAFYQALTGMSLAQINSYWSRLMFSGQTMPPQGLPNEQAMVDIVRRNPSAIGYLTQEPSDKTVRVVLVLKESK
jgi:hypothetical protein